jgi:hypothetical protein
LITYIFILNRKIELIKFACRARQLFIRILAVVKWAATTEKVTVCEVDIYSKTKTPPSSI